MEDKIRKSLRYSTLDGIFTSITQGFSENFITPYAIAMKASVSAIGVLSSLPNLMGSLSQLKTASVVDRIHSRMALITPCVLLHALMWIPIILAPYVVPDRAVPLLIALFTLYVLLNAFDIPAWSSLMADHVHEDERGSFFGWRNWLLGFINVGAAFMAGVLLNCFKGARLLGFTIIFSIAFVARLISWNFLRRMYDLPLTIGEEHKFSFAQFLKRLRYSNFGRFVIFVSAMNFSVTLFSPYLAVYMLQDLQFDYITYTGITLSVTVTSLACTKNWGEHADRAGNRSVLVLTSIFLPVIPFLWLLSHNVIYLVLVQIFAGFFWAGFNLSVSNFIFDAVSPEKRTRCIAYFNVVNGTALFSGALIGGFLMKWLPALLGYKILALALISGLLRIGSALLAGRVREVRSVREVSARDLFYSVIGVRPLP
jgi:MFS family permease